MCTLSTKIIYELEYKEVHTKHKETDSETIDRMNLESKTESKKETKDEGKKETKDESKKETKDESKKETKDEGKKTDSNVQTGGESNVVLNIMQAVNTIADKFNNEKRDYDKGDFYERLDSTDDSLTFEKIKETIKKVNSTVKIIPDVAENMSIFNSFNDLQFNKIIELLSYSIKIDQFIQYDEEKFTTAFDRLLSRIDTYTSNNNLIDEPKYKRKKRAERQKIFEKLENKAKKNEVLINNAVEAAGYLLMKKYKEKDGDKKVGGANSTSSNSQNGGKSNYNINKKNDHAILENLSDIKQLDMFLGKYDNIFYENLGSVYGNGNTIQSGGDSSKPRCCNDRGQNPLFYNIRPKC